MSSTPGHKVQTSRAAAGVAISPSDTPSPRPPSRSDGRRLPSIPSPDSQELMLRHTSQHTMPVSKGPNGYGPFFQEYNLMAEYNQLCSLKAPGIYVMPSAKSPRIWNGVLFIRQGLYQEGVFRFTLTIPDNFPDTDCDCPSVVFEYPVFHPLVHPVSGLLDVKKGFPKWRRNVNHIWQVLLYARRIFYKIETKAPLNQEAADLYHQDPEHYKKRVLESVQASKERIYEPPASDDPYAIRFSEWQPLVHEEALQEMLESKTSQGESRSGSPPSLGLSWVSLDTTQILSREDPATA
ncbi:AKT-interacting protein-like isoform X1 [Haliotis asinina]|uniref:AKT-interacting protein-like isoform X1 n=1 Tax=Haliotis asinina TaxID=109174 RepID=UPI00353209ED